MIPVAALVCAQALFVERFDTAVAPPAWNTASWNTRGGTYLYGITPAAAHSGSGGIEFQKTDAGTGNFVTPTFLGHDFSPPMTGEAHLRYWIRFERGTGPSFIWPLQVHDTPAVGTLAEAAVREAGGGTNDFALQAGHLFGFRSVSSAPPIDAGVWHLVQLDLLGVGTDAGVLAGSLDGVALETLVGLEWTASQLSRLLLGFGAVHDRWIGSHQLDDLLVLSERRAVKMQLVVPASIETGVCQPVRVKLSDLDGGPLPPPDVSVIDLAGDAGLEFFDDERCTVPWPAGGNGTTGVELRANFRATAAGELRLSSSSADLLGAEATTFAWVDAGSAPVDGGAEPVDAGAALQRRDYRVGCGCSSGPGLALSVLLLLARITGSSTSRSPGGNTSRPGTTAPVTRRTGRRSARGRRRSTT